MKNILKTIVTVLKKHVFNIVCGVVAIGAIVMGVMGVGAMDDVKSELDQIASLYNQFGAQISRPVNNKTIDAEKKRVETVKAMYEELLKEAHALNQYEPLPPPSGEQFFPEPTRDGKLQFPDIYANAFIQMIDALKAGEPPSDIDIQRMQEEMEDERRHQMSILDDSGSESSDLTDDLEIEPPHASGLITSQEAMQSAATRAAIRRAREIQCYASREAFDERTEIYEDVTPNLADMWDAQVSLWIQQDIVASIARINEQSAEALKADGERGWVATLPVKELISIRVSDYLPTERMGQRRSQAPSLAGDNPVLPPADPETVFTGSESESLYEVVQFTLKLVVDSRKLPTIIDELCKNRFHSLLNSQYVYDRDKFENLAMEGRIYGSDPAVTAVLDFETIFFGDLYRCMMPDEVLERIKQKCPDREPKKAAPSTTGRQGAGNRGGRRGRGGR